MSRYALIPSRSILGLFIFLLCVVLPVAAVADARVSEAYGQLPLHFEANRGQTHEDVRFFARDPGHSLYLTAGEAVLVLTRPNADAKSDSHSTPERLNTQARATPVVVRMSFVGAAPKPLVSGLDELPGKANYFIGNDPAKWRTNVPTYAKVHYRNVYPGIDVVYYGNQRQLEYDFVVASGADPQRIVLGFRGVERLEIDTDGDLVLHAAGGAIHQRKPVIYQEIDGTRREINGSYVLKGADRVGFQVAAYDRSRPLVIDPTLFYSTYLGGSALDFGVGIAVDAAGNAYVTGNTSSTNFPTTAGAFQTTFGGGGSDAFVTKLNSTGSALLYSTYLGGNGGELGTAIAVDPDSNAYVTGFTFSANYPVTPAAFQGTFGGGNTDIFVTKLNPTGSILVYSTYLGGNNGDQAYGIAVDAARSAYVTGLTLSTNFPVTPGAFQTTYGGGSVEGDAFVTKLNPTGSALVYSTYLGGSGDDAGIKIVVDAAFNAYVVGETASSLNFPTTPGAFQTTYGGGPRDAFVTKMNPTGTALLYSTYLGGNGDDVGGGVAIDAAFSAYVTGFTTSSNFPTMNAIQATYAGSRDAYVTKFNPMGTGLAYSTYLGGTGDDQGHGLALDSLPSPNAYVVGLTASTDFPTTSGAFQTSNAGSYDAFVAKITDVVLPPPSTVGKVTGAGTIDVPGGIGNFGFIVQARSTTGPVDGDLQYINHASGAKVHSVTFDSLVIAGTTATFGGTCTENGVPCTFSVTVQDIGEPGTNDSFTITIDAGPPEGANENLRSGNIQIHQ